MFTKYTVNGPSSRYRFLQYIPSLNRAGFDICVYPFFDETYLERLFSGRSPHVWNLVVRTLVRFVQCLRARRFDIVWIEGELFPFVPAFIERLLHPFLPRRRYYDFDDAIWLRYANRSALRHKIQRIIQSAQGVTAGNAFLADHLSPANHAVLILPTVLRWKKYAGIRAPLSGKTIGWIGTPKTVFFLHAILPALEVLAETHDFILRVIGASVTSDRFRVDCVQWSQQHETELLSQIDVGVMPLRDDDWSRGKCGLKLIQYLAVGAPAVASPVGVNSHIIEQSGGGFLARDQDQWVHALDQLLQSPTLRKKMGYNGRRWVENNLTVGVQAPRLVALFQGKPVTSIPQLDARQPSQEAVRE